MSHEICCQCEGATGRAGRADDSLYTDNDWGPYCEDCWGDADYWRCLTDEKVTENERLQELLIAAIRRESKIAIAGERIALRLAEFIKAASAANVLLGENDLAWPDYAEEAWNILARALDSDKSDSGQSEESPK